MYALHALNVQSVCNVYNVHSACKMYYVKNVCRVWAQYIQWGCMTPGEEARATPAQQCWHAWPQENKHKRRLPGNVGTHGLRRASTSDARLTFHGPMTSGEKHKRRLPGNVGTHGLRRASTSDARLTFHGLMTSGGKHKRLLLENFGMRDPRREA